MIIYPTFEKLAKVKKVNFIFGGIVVNTVALHQEGPGWAFLLLYMYVYPGCSGFPHH